MFEQTCPAGSVDPVRSETPATLEAPRYTLKRNSTTSPSCMT